MSSGCNRLLSPLRFGLAADPHYADTAPRLGRYFRQSADALAECVAEMNRQAADFLVELGDLKDQGDPPVEADSLAYLETIEAVLAEFDGPRYHVLGNHDCDSISKDQFQQRVRNTGIPADRTCYSFDCRGVHGVVLDANFRADGVAYDHGNFDWRDTWIPAEQLEWLEQDLGASDGPVIVFVHQQLDGIGDHAVNNADEVRHVLEQSGRVRAVFQGHQHDGGYRCLKGIHYVTLRAMVNGTGRANNAYALVELSPDGHLSVQGYRRAETRELL